MNRKTELEHEQAYVELHRLLVDMTLVMNSPRRDSLLLARAKVKLDRALFPLLSLIGLRGPVGVVELAEIVGRDYSTVSRQLKKLEALGLTRATRSTSDRRSSVSVATAKGRRILEKLEKARRSYIDEVLRDWKPSERLEMIAIMKKLVGALKEIEP